MEPRRRGPMRIDDVHLGKGVWRQHGQAGAQTSLEAWAEILPPGSVFTGLTAADAHGLWLPELPINMPLTVVMPRRPGEVVPRHGAVEVLRNARLPGYVVRGQARVSTVPETLLSCARFLGLLDLVVLIDAALHLEKCTLDALYGLTPRRQRGVVRFREALLHVDARSESPWETRLRLLHTASGVTVTPQVEFRDEAGRFVARADLVVTRTGQIQEYDGAVHREAEVHRRDLARERRLADAGLQRRGWTATDLLNAPETVVASIARQLGRPIAVHGWTWLVWNSLHRPGGRRELCRSLRPGLVWPDAQKSVGVRPGPGEESG